MGEVVFDLAGSAVDDVLYLPAVSPGFASARAALARDSLATGAPVLVQMLAGDDPQRVVTETRPLSAFFLTQPDDGEAFSRTLPTEPQTATAAPELLVVLDLLDPLLRGDLAALERAPAGVLAAWPLLPGLSDDPALWEEGCARLAAAGVRQAQAVTVRLSPRDRRWLAERRPPGSYDALFHREPPPERAFDRVAHRHGLAPLPARPLPRAPRAVRANRRLAGALALAAELWLRLGRPVGQGEALYRAARFADRSEHDLEALAREGNLALLDWLDPLGRDVVRETAAAGTSFLVEELLAEYLG